MYIKQKFKSIKQHLRTVRLYMGKKILDQAPWGQEIEFQKIRSILFLRQDGKIGDCVVSSFVFREIKKQRPDVQIGVLCHQDNVHLFENNVYIDKIHKINQRGMVSYWRAGKALRHQYDIVIDPTYLLRNRDLLLLRTINAPFNIGYEKSDYQLFNRSVNGHLHYTDVYHHALKICGFGEMNVAYELPSSSPNATAIQVFLAQNQLHDYVAINFFGASNSRCFTAENIKTMMQILHTEFPQQQWVLLGYPAVNAMLCNLNLPQCFVYAETVLIDDNVELMRHAKMVISPDTAIVHIAVGLGKPLIACYSALTQNFINWRPYDADAQILRYQTNINEIKAEKLIPLIQKLM